jgi:hypothetical protein
VELAEAYADGEVTQTELTVAHDHPDLTDIEALLRGEKGPRTRFSARVIFAIEAAQFLAAPNFFQFNGGPSFVVSLTSRNPANDFVPDPGWYIGGQEGGCGADEAEFARKTKLLRDIFGNPFHPVAFRPEWRTDTVVLLARQMYESRDFAAMPIMADALQEGGCEDEQVLKHCRGTGPHVRGCWVVDLVLGKE